MKLKLDSMPLGVLTGIVFPVIVLCGYYFINYSYMSLSGFLNYLILGGVYLPLISLCVVANLLVFFIFIWREDYQTTRGILLSTFLYAGIVFYMKLV